MLVTLLHANQAASAVFDVPKLDKIAVDGTASDWGERGYRVEILTTPDGEIRPARDFDVAFRIGWDPVGLLVLVTVQDDVPREGSTGPELWREDSVELLVGAAIGSSNRYAIVVAAGADPRYGTRREQIYDRRPSKLRHPEIVVHTAAKVIDGGYVVEARLPWRNVGVTPGFGTEVAFQLCATDDDGEVDGQPDDLVVSWYPSVASYRDPTKMYRLRLARHAGNSAPLKVHRAVAMEKATVLIWGTRELAGAPVVVRAAKGVVAQGKLASVEGRAAARFNVGDNGRGVPALTVEVAEKPVASFGASPTVGGVLNRYLEAVGGRSAIATLRNRMATGKHVELRSGTHSQVTSELEAFAEASGRFKLVLRSNQKTVGQGFDGRYGWRQNEHGVSHDERVEHSHLAWLLNPQGPLLTGEYFPNLRMRGRDTVAGNAVYVMSPAGRDPANHALYFDLASGLLRQIGDSLRIKDYRAIDGVKAPRRLERRTPSATNTYELREIKHNVSLTDVRFAVPDAAKLLPQVFRGIDDPKVLTPLTFLPYEHGGMNVSSTDGRFLYDIIVERGYRRGLEIGTSNGYSTLWLALAFRETGGHVTTLEYNPKSAKEAQKNFHRANLAQIIDLRIADALTAIPQLKGEFDFVFIDAWKPDYAAYFRLLRKRIAPGGVITAHNVESHRAGMADFLHAIQDDPNFTTTIHKVSDQGISVSFRRSR